MTHGACQARSISDQPEWQRTLERHGAEHGYHRRLDAFHGALFTEDDDTLIVTFEEADDFLVGPPPNLPLGLAIAGREGWSHLCLYSEGTTFFRSEAVYTFIDELIDDGFFDDFERVIFYGAGACGYAAAAYSVAAPGSTVVLVRPLATLAPDKTRWDRRHPHMRRTDFTSRYGYAPDMVEGAEQVLLIHDPRVPEDAMHATLFDRPDILRLDCRWLGRHPERDLLQMGVLLPLLRAAGKGGADAALFYRLYRARMEHKPYLRRLARKLDSERRPALRNQWSRAVEAALAEDD